MAAADGEASGSGGLSVLCPDGPGVFEDGSGFALRGEDGTSYRVDLCDRVFSPDQPLLSEYCGDRRVTVFVSPAVNRYYGDRIRAYFRAWRPSDSWRIVVFPTGEHRKTMASVERICATAAEVGLDRRGIMVAVGGGIICDMVGFAASIYARGIDYIKVNTSLVGQVDVGVGIKTGVNALGTKNMLGAYHAPWASLNDPGLLRTLPPREVQCGFAEIIKMAVIRDADFFADLEGYPGATGQGEGTRLPTGDPRTGAVIRTAMRLMLLELQPNLRESELARLVDFGHSFSPAIEVASGYQIKHGEAVAIDMALSTVIARAVGLLDQAACERILALLERFGLPLLDPHLCVPELMMDALRASWLRRGRRLHLVLPTGVGSASFLHDLADLPPLLLEEALSVLAAWTRRRS